MADAAGAVNLRLQPLLQVAAAIGTNPHLTGVHPIHGIHGVSPGTAERSLRCPPSFELVKPAGAGYLWSMIWRFRTFRQGAGSLHSAACRSGGALLTIWSIATARLLGVEPPASALAFESHIRPILKAHCFDCHGEGDRLKADLDLRLVRWMIRGGESGPALRPGQPEDSLIYERVKSGEMPKRERKLSSEEVALIRRWIAEGARTLRPEPQRLEGGMQITDEERRHWSFRPLTASPPPEAVARSAQNPIDSFLLRDLQGRGLGFAEPASARVLIRRAYLDLWGLPPPPEAIAAFESDTAPDAYERLIDRLLESPRYGERWARHWLDIAGYADSDGYTNEDAPRPYAYKYRDYVIRAFNESKPFDRFVLEQLAGDELALAKHARLEEAVQDPETREWLVATGFLRMACDGTASGAVNQDVARNQVMADTLKIVSTSLLGLSMGCAQCHDHRYDPIRQVDYYALRAFFEPAYDWKQWRKPGERLLSLYSEQDRRRAAEVDATAAALSREREQKQAAFIDAAFKKHLETFDVGLREPLWAAFKTPADKRSDAQKKLLSDNPSANIHPGVLYQYNPQAAEELKAMDSKIDAVKGRKPPEDFVSALWEHGGPAPKTQRFHRGDPTQPREEVAPGVPLVLAATRNGARPEPGVKPVPVAGSTGRRSALARWLTCSDDPLLARVWVNRVWMHHFGRGLTGTPADFGTQGEPPSHPELLDWLAHAFAARTPGADAGAVLGWDLKALHRLIMTSRAYRQGADFDPVKTAADPENRLYGRRAMVRMDAEAMRDSMLAVSGVLNLRMHGPPVPVREDAVGQIVVGVDRKQGDNKTPVEVAMGGEEFRRSIYVEVRRTRPLAVLNTFDAPVMEVNCERRQSSTVAPQALMLMNSDFALQMARHFAARLKSEGGSAAEERIRYAWRLAYGRTATTMEVSTALRYLEAQRTAFCRTGSPTPGAVGRGAPADTTPEDRALASLCQALLGSNEFLYVE